MKLTIRLALLLALCAAPLRAGTFEVKPGESFGKVSAANDGDTFIIHPGAVITGNVRITGKVNVTIIGAELASDPNKILVKPVWNTPGDRIVDVTDPATVLRLPSVIQFALTVNNCPNFTINGIEFVKGGLRVENCANFTARNFVAREAGYGGIELDGHVEGNNGSTLGLRKNGADFKYVACIQNAASGFNLSWQTNITGDYVYSLRNNPGTTKQQHINGGPWDGYTASNGLDYAKVQVSGGGGKWSGVDNVRISHYYGADNIGVQQWCDWLNSSVTLTDSYFGFARWMQGPGLDGRDYDATGSMMELDSNGVEYVRCTFERNVLGSNMAEVHDITFTDCDWIANVATHRNINRGVVMGNIRYNNCRWYLGGGLITGWAGLNFGQQIFQTGSLFDQPAPSRYSWWKRGGSTTQPVDPVDPGDDTSVVSAAWTKVPPARNIVTADHHSWRITTAGQISVDGQVKSETNGVNGLVWDGTKLYQTAHTLWWFWTGNGWQQTDEPRQTTTQPTDPTTQPSFKGVTVTTEVDVDSAGKATVRGAPTTRPKAPVP
jgi:hypothetical protein